MGITNEQIEETIIQIAGNEALPLYKILKGKENVNEFEIANKLKLTINQIRNTLYKFDNKGLLESKRKKDRKKGWYIYFWTLDQEKLNNLVIKIKQDRLKFIERKLTEEQHSEFYVCKNNCIRMDSQQALDSDYVCHECGQVLELEDSSKIHSRLKKEIGSLKIELEKTEKKVEVKKKLEETPKKEVKKKNIVKKESVKKESKKVSKKK